MKYRNKLKLYGSVLAENELEEITKNFIKIKDIYCNIKPFHGGTKSVSGTDIQESYNTQRILVRKLSIKKPEIDMYFKDAAGQKYKVLDFYPNYKDNSEWEFRTRIEYE